MKTHHATEKRRQRKDLLVVGILIFLGACFIALDREHDALISRYGELFSKTITDRNGEVIMREPNSRGAYTRDGEIPERLKELVLKKEDQWFSYHPGINPWSMVRVTLQFARGNRQGGASTITQQLTKILLNNEDDRNLKNKVRETLDAFVLELFHTKKDIFDMYARAVYLGNGAVGFPEASVRYFGKPLTKLSDSELVALVAALGNPSARNPWQEDSIKYVRLLSEELGVPWQEVSPIPKRSATRDGDSAFELRSIHATCPATTCMTTIDQGLNAQLRSVAKKVTEDNAVHRATNAAIVVLELPSRKVLALVGSPDQHSLESGNQINMALSPRQAGSTVKPLIFAAGFSRGLRPYTLVDDDEYRYDIATGFPLYPKNYDGKYHGRVTLEHALGNSLNVPAVKVLEYVGVKPFTDMLTRDLGFRSQVPIESYQYGIALGGLETDLMTLTHLLSVFGTNGTISPITLWQDQNGTSDPLPPMDVASTSQVFDPRYVALTNSILSDRTIGVEQFGLKSNLGVDGNVIAVKTGTSRDYHDSWTVGWSPDFIVGVWVGNTENKALESVSGSSGAGKIWHDAMEILMQSPYNKHTPFNTDNVVTMGEADAVGYGLRGDNYEATKNMLVGDNLIMSPHEGDAFLFTKDTAIPLVGRTALTWEIDGKKFASGTSTDFYPPHPSTYTITASNGSRKESLTITVNASTDLPRNNN